MSAAHIADTGFLVALGDQDNERYRRVRAFAMRNDITFLLPERVYDELTGDVSTPEQVPVDTAIEEGWVTVANPLDYTTSQVASTMDGVKRYIANADDRPEDEIERADAALGGLATQLLTDESVTGVYIYTPDIAAGEGIETVLATKGYEDTVTFVNAFRFIEDLL